MLGHRHDRRQRYTLTARFCYEPRAQAMRAKVPLQPG